MDIDWRRNTVQEPVAHPLRAITYPAGQGGTTQVNAVREWRLRHTDRCNRHVEPARHPCTQQSDSASAGGSALFTTSARRRLGVGPRPKCYRSECQRGMTVRRCLGIGSRPFRRHLGEVSRSGIGPRPGKHLRNRGLREDIGSVRGLSCNPFGDASRQVELSGTRTDRQRALDSPRR